MLIKSVTLKNFRGYCGTVSIPFDKLTAFVGKNDIGKSSVLEALDIFPAQESFQKRNPRASSCCRFMIRRGRRAEIIAED